MSGLRDVVGLLIFYAVMFALILLFTLALVVFARAHPAECPAGVLSGWEYDQGCCAGKDCEMLSDTSVLYGRDYIYIHARSTKWKPEGEWVTERVPYGDRRIKYSKDNCTHWCLYETPYPESGEFPGSRVRCLYVKGGRS